MAAGPSVAVIHLDAGKTAGFRRDQIDHPAYHLARLLTGQGTATAEWEHLGLSIDVEMDSDGGPES